MSLHKCKEIPAEKLDWEREYFWFTEGNKSVFLFPVSMKRNLGKNRGILYWKSISYKELLIITEEIDLVFSRWDLINFSKEVMKKIFDRIINSYCLWRIIKILLL